MKGYTVSVASLVLACGCGSGSVGAERGGDAGVTIQRAAASPRGLPGQNLECGSSSVLSTNPERFSGTKHNSPEDAAAGWLGFYYPKGPSISEYELRNGANPNKSAYVYADAGRDVAELVVAERVGDGYRVEQWAACESHTRVWGRG